MQGHRHLNSSPPLSLSISPSSSSSCRWLGEEALDPIIYRARARRRSWVSRDSLRLTPLRATQIASPHPSEVDNPRFQRLRRILGHRVAGPSTAALLRVGVFHRLWFGCLASRGVSRHSFGNYDFMGFPSRFLSYLRAPELSQRVWVDNNSWGGNDFSKDHAMLCFLSRLKGGNHRHCSSLIFLDLNLGWKQQFVLLLIWSQWSRYLDRAGCPPCWFLPMLWWSRILLHKRKLVSRLRLWGSIR